MDVSSKSPSLGINVEVVTKGIAGNVEWLESYCIVR
jgi:hypothetical protein